MTRVLKYDKVLHVVTFINKFIKDVLKVFAGFANTPSPIPPLNIWGSLKIVGM